MEKQQLIEIGQRLRKRRRELGLTRDKMSELADIGSGYHGQLEVGTSHLPMEYSCLGKDMSREMRGLWLICWGVARQENWFWRKSCLNFSCSKAIEFQTLQRKF